MQTTVLFTGSELKIWEKDETVWLTQAQMSELFAKDRTVITRHINNIFKEEELEQKSIRFIRRLWS